MAEERPSPDRLERRLASLPWASCVVPQFKQKTELSRNEPELRPRARLPFGIDRDHIGNGILVGWLDFGFVTAEVDPGFRQVFEQAAVLLPGHQRTQEAMAGVVFCRDIVDFT